LFDRPKPTVGCSANGRRRRKLQPIQQIRSVIIEKNEGVHLYFKVLNAELKPICHLLPLLGAHHILHVSRIMVKDRKKKI